VRTHGDPQRNASAPPGRASLGAGRSGSARRCRRQRDFLPGEGARGAAVAGVRHAVQHLAFELHGIALMEEPFDTTASTDCSRQAGSRNGQPAGESRCRSRGCRPPQPRDRAAAGSAAAIVEDQHVNVIMRGAQGCGDSHAVRADPYRATAAAGENNRLVTDLGGLIGYGGRARRSDPRAVAARHDARRPAFDFRNSAIQSTSGVFPLPRP